MKRAFFASLLGLALVSTFTMGSGMAMAAKDKKPKVDSKDKKFDFEADEVNGELVKPDGLDSTVRVYKEHTSLIRVRQDFIREIVKSAEDL